MRIDKSSWKVPPLFALIRSQGNVPETEMFRTFNMGAGMLVVVAAADADATIEIIGPDAWQIGQIVPRAGRAVELV